MNLADMSARKRRDTVNLALAFVLQDITQPCSTGEIVDLLAHRLATRELELLGRTVVALAPLYPEAKRGAEFVKFGRSMRRWIWSPRGAASADWSVPAAKPGDRVARAAAALDMTIEEYREWASGPELA